MEEVRELRGRLQEREDRVMALEMVSGVEERLFWVSVFHQRCVCVCVCFQESRNIGAQLSGKQTIIETLQVIMQQERGEGREGSLYFCFCHPNRSK